MSLNVQGLGSVIRGAQEAGNPVTTVKFSEGAIDLVLLEGLREQYAVSGFSDGRQRLEQLYEQSPDSIWVEGDEDIPAVELDIQVNDTQAVVSMQFSEDMTISDQREAIAIISDLGKQGALGENSVKKAEQVISVFNEAVQGYVSGELQAQQGAESQESDWITKICTEQASQQNSSFSKGKI